MLWQIAVPLCMPIFALNILNTFTATYGSFMWAFMVCQKQEMWTLMVWLYQFSHHSLQHVKMAAYVVASIPTLLVFIFCQRIILRGIILPTFH